MERHPDSPLRVDASRTRRDPALSAVSGLSVLPALFRLVPINTNLDSRPLMQDTPAPPFESGCQTPRRESSSPTTSPTCSRRSACCSRAKASSSRRRARRGALLRAAGGSGVRRLADRPQLHARHHDRPRRARPARQAPGARRDAAGDRDDGVGHRGGRGGGDAARRARLRREAVGQRAAARHAAHPGGARARAPRDAPARGREPAAARHRRAPRARRRVARRCSAVLSISSSASRRATRTC